MMPIIFKEPWYLWSLVLIPPLWMLFSAAAQKRREAMRGFSGSHPLVASEQQRLLRRRSWTMTCYCVASGILVVALARPAWTRIPVEAGSQGRDVLFLLDVSNSMLAEDLAPNRLERAKQGILDCVKSLEGDRVGLGIFAGSPSIVCPLTTDYSFFRSTLAEASPENVSQGGTRIGDAIRKSVDKLLDEKRRGRHDLILITDGGDQESQPENAVVELEEMGVFLIVVGLGDERKGAPIPLRGVDNPMGERKYMTYKGKPVWSSLESAPLNRMAAASRNGVYLNAGTRAFDLGEVYHRLVEHFETQVREGDETTLRYRDEFQWFLVIGLLALCLPHLAGMRRKFRPVVAVLALCLVWSSDAYAQADGAMLLDSQAEDMEGITDPREGVALEHEEKGEPVEYYNEGCRLLDLRLFEEALTVFRLALQGAEDEVLRVRACYNLGNCYFRGAEAIMSRDQVTAVQFFGLSAVAFRTVLDYERDHEDAAWNLELARRREKELLEALQSEREGEDAESEESESQEESKDGEPGEDGEDMESEDTEESEEGDEGKPSDYSASDLALDLDSEGIPPPMVDPEDIFQEEAMNNELRQKKGAKYQPVEKDW